MFYGSFLPIKECTGVFNLGKWGPKHRPRTFSNRKFICIKTWFESNFFPLERTPCMSRVLQINNINSPSATWRGRPNGFWPSQGLWRLVTAMLEGIIVRRPAGTISIFCQEFLIKRVSLLNIDAAPSPTFKNFDIGTKFPLESGLQERKNLRKINLNFNFKT